MWSYAGTSHLMKYNLGFFKIIMLHIYSSEMKNFKKELVSEGGQGTLVEHIAKSG